MARSSLRAHSRGPHTPPLCGVFLVWVLAVLPIREAPAQSPPAVRFRAEVSQTLVRPGEPIRFELVLEMRGNVQVQQQPEVPDFGGLKVRSGPTRRRNMTQNLGGPMRLTLVQAWELMALEAGTYTIGPSRARVGNRFIQTEPIDITVSGDVGQVLPRELAGEPIIFAHTNNPQANDLLEGRLFIRTRVSDPTPYEGQVVRFAYELYRDRTDVQIRNLEPPANVEGAVQEELHQAKRLQFQPRMHERRQFQVAKVYEQAVVPEREGELEVGGITLRGWLDTGPSTPSVSDPFGDPYFESFFDDPFFRSDRIAVEIPTPPVRLRVRPLPDQGRPPGFSGTVGDYTLMSRLDRPQATEDDIITLEITLQGQGAVAMAAAPEFPESVHFTLLERNARLDTEADATGGKKYFEFLLRPTHSGRLTVPPIEYTFFDPGSGEYRVVRTEPQTVMVSPGRIGDEDARREPPGALRSGAAPENDLHYLKPIGSLRGSRPRPLLQAPGFWGIQALLLAGVVVAWAVDRRRGRLDRAARRRAGAWRTYRRRLRQVHKLLEDGRDPSADPARAARCLGGAVRGLFADLFDCSAEGLTRRDIQQTLAVQAVPADRIERLGRLLDRCDGYQYAPSRQIDPAELARIADQLDRLLREDVCP